MVLVDFKNFVSLCSNLLRNMSVDLRITALPSSVNRLISCSYILCILFYVFFFHSDVFVLSVNLKTF